MESLRKVIIIITFTSALIGGGEGRKARNVEELTRCVRMAEPLVHNPEFVLPLTKQEIHNVCRMWGSFVDCVRSYTSHFLTPDQLDAFGKAIEPSMQSIHQLCVDEAPYRDAYLQYAPCMKRMYISPEHCGTHYQYLADLVKGNSASPDLLCCAHHKFRNCVLSETPRECGTVVPAVALPSQERTVAATQFVTAMLDRALGFLLQQCRDYVPSPGVCPGADEYKVQPVPSTHYNINNQDGTPSPYAPSTSFTWTPPSNIYPRNLSATSTNNPWDYTPEFNDIAATKTNFRKDVVNNRIDEPTSQQFRGVTSGAQGGHCYYLSLIVLALAGIILSYSL